MLAANPLQRGYDELSTASKADLKGSITSQKLISLIKTSLDFLESDCIKVKLISMVAGKEYYSFARKTTTSAFSRPVNGSLFVSDSKWMETNWRLWPPSPEALGKMFYTMATAYSVASDLFDRNNKKTPATFFEVFVGHCVAKRIGVNPTKAASFNIAGRKVSMTMDFIFDVGQGKPRIHLPVKLSTRERVVQAWSHQRMLDAAYGVGAYRALLVVHSETKLDSVKREVVEICVPDQWLAYQSLLAKMDCIYFFDMPGRYLTLTKAFPNLLRVCDYRELFTGTSAGA